MPLGYNDHKPNVRNLIFLFGNTEMVNQIINFIAYNINKIAWYWYEGFVHVIFKIAIF